MRYHLKFTPVAVDTANVSRGRNTAMLEKEAVSFGKRILCITPIRELGHVPTAGLFGTVTCAPGAWGSPPVLHAARGHGWYRGNNSRIQVGRGRGKGAGVYLQRLVRTSLRALSR